ncbi:hypothetical protein BH11PSE13_BH11PSE13_12330 [soil metagenome]
MKKERRLEFVAAANAPRVQKSVTVYGPQGCGLTMHSERIQKAFGLDRVQDLDGHGVRCRQPVGTLYLTNLTRDELLARGWIEEHTRRVYSFDEAMAMSEGETQ